MHWAALGLVLVSLYYTGPRLGSVSSKGEWSEPGLREGERTPVSDSYRGDTKAGDPRRSYEYGSQQPVGFTRTSVQLGGSTLNPQHQDSVRQQQQQDDNGNENGNDHGGYDSERRAAVAVSSRTANL